jgi:hypothetical protein
LARLCRQGPDCLELYAQADARELDLRPPVVVDSTNRTFGPTGVAQFQDPASISLRDLAFLMLKSLMGHLGTPTRQRSGAGVPT